MVRLQKLAIDAYCWLFCVQARFLAWQIEKIGQRCPGVETLSPVVTGPVTEVLDPDPDPVSDPVMLLADQRGPIAGLLEFIRHIPALNRVEQVAETRQLPRPVGIAISRLVVARRRAING